MAGIVPLQKVQLGRESTAGTAVAATVIYRGKAAMIQDALEVVLVDEQIGVLGGTDRSYIPFVEAKVTFPDTEATFEQILHFLEAGIKTATAVQDGSGTDYIYTYAFPTTSKNTIKTYTIEGGDDQQEEEFAYAFVEKFKLSGKSKEAVMMSGDWIGRQVSASTFTSLSLPTVESILFQKGKLYIDAIGGTVGTTQVSSSLLGFELNVITGWHTKYTADGTLYFTFHEAGNPEVELKVTWEHNTNATTEKTNWRAQTPRQIQLKFEGSTVGTPGTTYSVKTLIVNLSGKWMTFDAITGENGNSVITGTFRARLNSTSGYMATIIVVNELSAVP